MLFVSMCRKSFSISSVKTACSASVVWFSEYPHSQAALAANAHGQYVWLCSARGTGLSNESRLPLSTPTEDDLPKRDTASKSQGMTPFEK